jgi:hypothetical protein
MIEKNSDTIRSVAWAEIFPWLSLARVFRLAITIRSLVLGAVGVLLTVLAWCLIAWALCPDISTEHPGDATAWLQPYVNRPWTTMTETLPGPWRCPLHAKATDAPTEWWQKDPVTGPWATLSQPALSSISNEAFPLHDAVCLILCGLTGVAIWAFFGAAICRTAAVRLAADEQIGLGSALRYACRKWPAYFAAPLLPVGGVILAMIPVLILGWLIQTNVGLAFCGTLLWPLVLVAAFVMAILLIGVLFGFPLMWSAISAEGTDSFDALSRSYAYVFQRPLRYLFYIAVAAILGWLGWILVWYFAEGVIALGYWAASWGCGGQQIDCIKLAFGEGLNSVGRFGAHAINFWSGCVRLLAIGYMFSYFWTASAAVYFQLRHDIDATELDEVFLDADASEPTPATSPEGSAAVNGETV